MAALISQCLSPSPSCCFMDVVQVVTGAERLKCWREGMTNSSSPLRERSWQKADFAEVGSCSYSP